MFVDHIVELKDGGAPLDQNNLQVLCSGCHNRKTAIERNRRCGPSDAAATHPEWVRPPALPVVIVCGPPAAGKSTFVRQHAGPRDVIIDLDEIASRLAKTSWHGWPEYLLTAALRERNKLLDQLADNIARDAWAWLIVAEPRAAHRGWWAKKLRAERVIVLETAEVECERRIAEDPERQCNRARLSLGLARWFNEYTRRADDEVIKWEGGKNLS